MSRVISWFSCGAASAVATWIAQAEHPELMPVYCDTGAEHPDNARFMRDCERLFRRPVTVIKSEKYVDTWHVWKERRYLAGVEGALCTVEMKKVPRYGFQMPTDHHIFGYTADRSDAKRFERFKENYPELSVQAPLIEHGITKADCLMWIAEQGIVIPKMYSLGFSNNNCIPCVKATSPGYWALVRKHFPEEFRRMAELSRALDVRLTRIKNVRMFIDEIPADYPVTEAIVPSCDFACDTEAQEE